MRSTIIAPFLALAASVSALQITFPASQNASLDLSKSNTITWTTVTSDPEAVKIQLVNNQINPPVALTVAEKVETKDLKYTLEPFSGAKTGKGYQINFVGVAGKNTGIVAQSNQFTIEKVAANETKATTTSASSGASATQTGAPAATTSASGNAAGNLKAWGGAGVLALFVALLI